MMGRKCKISFPAAKHYIMKSHIRQVDSLHTLWMSALAPTCSFFMSLQAAFTAENLTYHEDTGG
jgi:hypothetical protein